MAIKLTLRLSDEDAELLEAVMTLTRQKTASKAILALVRGYKYQSTAIDIADRRIQELIDQVAIYERAIENAKAVCEQHAVTSSSHAHVDLHRILTHV